MLKRLFALAMLALPAFAHAQTPPPAKPKASIASPDGSLAVEITSDNDGRAYYTVARRGKPVIARSNLGFILAGTPNADVCRELKLTPLFKATDAPVRTQRATAAS